MRTRVKTVCAGYRGRAREFEDSVQFALQAIKHAEQ